MLPAGGNAEYYAEDLLGSSRVTTTNNGTVCYDADFYPYGGERAYTNSCPSSNVYKFEGKERDTETGNDDFGARYYSNRFGRWLSADWSSTPVAVPYANLTNPQTLNLYAMVSDDPESFADLDGHDDCCSFWQVVNFLAGAVNAYASDNLVGAGRQDQNTTEGKLGAAAGDTVAAVQGVTEVVLGGAGEVGGTALDATGVGAIAGVPLNAISVIPLVHGGATAGEAVGHLGAAAGDAINDAIHKPVESRSGKQERLSEIGNDDKASSADRGWIKQEQNAVDRGQRTNKRNPPGKDLAHERGREAAKGYDYKQSNLQNRKDHRTQHKYDKFGRKNKERPLNQ